MGQIEKRLQDLGIQLPKPMNIGPLPFELVRVHGQRAVLSGHLPLDADGKIAKPLGKVGAEVSVEEGYAAARKVGLGLLASLQQALGGLDAVAGWVKLFGMVNAAPGFNALPSVVNGCSELILEVFGPDVGAHAPLRRGPGRVAFRGAGGGGGRGPHPPVSKLRIVNARIVNEGAVRAGDLLIDNGRIAAVGEAPDGNCATLDAAGAYLLPGMIDDQVHFREPGFTHKGDIASESAAAVAGGVTSYMEMPNCNPLTISQTTLDDKRRRAEGRSHANFAFYLGATNDNLEAIKSVDPATTCGVKVFMGASTGNMLVDDPKALEGIFASTPLLIATHCEDTPSILANEAAARQRYGEDVPMAEHPRIRSAEACYKSSSLAVQLAKRHGAKLHVLHLTTAGKWSCSHLGTRRTSASPPKPAYITCASTMAGTPKRAQT